MDKGFKEKLENLSKKIRIDSGFTSGRGRFKYRSYPLIANQAIYVTSMRNHELVYHRNIKELLGYSDKEFTYDSLFSAIHPDDYPDVKRIVGSTLQVFAQKGLARSSAFFLTYRMRKKDGSYIHVQRTSGVCSLQANKTLRGHFSIIEDISYQYPSAGVRWLWHLPGCDVNELRKEVSNSVFDELTIREMEVLLELRQGQTSEDIAKRLNISVSTVNSHRQNIILKSGAKSTVEAVQSFERSSMGYKDLSQ
ncbi:MAG TPA: LuxR C-terminal-related transcriptional regulator [Cryomorphaceae bacterium]|nr:LuxR C-terminal-related transcriptional regulator [Cryomorphaceae bacterium]